MRRVLPWVFELLHTTALWADASCLCKNPLRLPWCHRRVSSVYFEHSSGVLSFHWEYPVGFARRAARALLRRGDDHRTGYSSCDVPARFDPPFRVKQLCALRIFLPICGRRVLAYCALNRGTVLLNCCDPVSEPLSQLFIFVELMCQRLPPGERSIL
jgi:hypothetical protein